LSLESTKKFAQTICKARERSKKQGRSFENDERQNKADRQVVPIQLHHHVHHLQFVFLLLVSQNAASKHSLLKRHDINVMPPFATFAAASQLLLPLRKDLQASAGLSRSIAAQLSVLDDGKIAS
jgi:hypothetical protein